MKDEAANGSAGAPQRGRSSGSGGGDGSPLQARAAFLKNWGWQSVVHINQGACERGGAQHGANSETQEACAAEWEATHGQELTLAGTFDLLRDFHRKAPFLFFNGNTFATIGRELAVALFADLPPERRRIVSSAVAHYIAGVLDRESMVLTVAELCAKADLEPGDRVKTLRGSLSGRIVRVLEDGRIVWQPEGSARELVCLPESLLRLDNGRGSEP